MKNFTEFAKAVKADARLSELVARYDADTESLTDAEFSEMCDRYDRAYGDPFDPVGEDPADLFGPWWD